LLQHSKSFMLQFGLRYEAWRCVGSSSNVDAIKGRRQCWPLSGEKCNHTYMSHNKCNTCLVFHIRSGNLNWCWKYKIVSYCKDHKKFSKTFIKHCNVCFLALKRLINRLPNFWKLHVSWNLLHKISHNNINF
jgi:hypothetical protein